MLQVFRPWGHYARAEAGLGFPTMADVVFDVDGEMVSVPEAEARIWGEKLIGFAAGNWGDDVALLTAHGHDPKWLEGARALGRPMRTVPTERGKGRYQSTRPARAQTRSTRCSHYLGRPAGMPQA